MTVAVVTKEEHDAVVRRLVELERTVADLAKSGAAPAREYLTPRQVAKRCGVGNDQVYAALESGRLKGQSVKRGGKHGHAWRIRPEDARAWYEAFIAKKAEPA